MSEKGPLIEKELFEHCVQYTNRKQVYSEGNRNNYIFVLANNCNRRGLLKESVVSFCKAKFNLSVNELEATVYSAYENISQHGKSKKKKTNIHEIEFYLSEKYEFRRNIVSNKIEFKRHEKSNFQIIDDYFENSLFRELNKAGIKCYIGRLRSILGSDFCEKFNPFTTYINSLPKWEGEVDYIKQLADTVKTTQQELWEKCLRMWIVAMIGSAVDDSIINHTVLILCGRQGVGKTSWILKLAPGTLKDYVFTGTIIPNDKDTLVNLSECLLINLDELENLSKSEIGSLKELITKPLVRIRVPYGRNNENKVRRASFTGSVNDKLFLADITGSRRFLPFEVIHLDFHHSIEMDKVYAQALHLLNNGFKYWLNEVDIKSIEEHNEQFQIKSMEEESLLTWFEKPTDDNNNISYLSTTEIAMKISNVCKFSVSNSAVRALGKALHKHNFDKIKRKGRYVYKVIEKSNLEVISNEKNVDF